MARATRTLSVKLATPEASSSEPGARPVVGLLELTESRWPPITTTSPGRVVPAMVSTTDGCAQPAWLNSSTVTSPRPCAYVSQRLRSQLAASTPVCVV